MTTELARCVLCRTPLEESHLAAVKPTETKCSVFVNQHDSLINELWAWVSSSTESPLEGMCGLIIDDVPHRAISESFEVALKILPFLKSAAAQSKDQFKLVRFVKEKVVAQI